MKTLVPADWMPPCRMKAIVAHWTAGAHKASAVDREHYHILIEADGKLVRGDHEISDNVSTADDDYAAHTRHFNTNTIGIAVCCMADANEKPFRAGKFPMTEFQWATMAHVAANLAAQYVIPVDRKHVLQHGEVQKNLEIMQRGKWDCMVLPWNKKLTYEQAGDAFRAAVLDFMTQAP